MINKSFKLRSSSFFRQRTHGKDTADNRTEVVKPESEGEETERVVRDILRWADDGGKMLELGRRTARSDPAAAPKQVNELCMSAGKEAQRAFLETRTQNCTYPKLGGAVR